MTLPADAPRLRPFADVCATAIGVAFLVGWWTAGPVAEGGALDLATVVGLILVTGMMVLRLPSLAFGPEWHLPVITLLLALRELDFDKRFMETGVLKLRLYTGDAPLASKAVGACVIGLILTCLYRLIRHNGPDFRLSLRAREGWAVAIGLGVLAGIVAKSIDGLGRKLAPFGIDLSDAQTIFAATAQETLEFGFAAALLLALFLWIRRYA
ncbi:hypothetical protein [Jannaschia donghaensis]|uniref:Uncharacterized protein n=1 Tax=Jannaschia donghaensis TaxID=420998 RepID=A0A0M6YHT5_9RHOB|nr:hypothetical protein [Jannaschia donghaensis]CTQ49918.1 hypothetical protein JDO7802_01935 [Jannaschia donghaensis]